MARDDERAGAGEAGQKRVIFDFALEFASGGGLQGQGFRLDIPGEDISDEALAEYLVRDRHLLMVGKGSIANKRVVLEQHKRPGSGQA
jgi:hypothetical protein